MNLNYGDEFSSLPWLFLQAEDGVGLPEQILDKSSFGSAAKYYFIFIRFDLIWSLNYFALIVLNFFEVSINLSYFLCAIIVTALAIMDLFRKEDSLNMLL